MASLVNLPTLIIPARHSDNRGWLSEVYREETLHDRGIRCTFVQENKSHSIRKGTLRGLHYQGPPHAQAKLVSVQRGRIFDVAVDIRRNSPTFGKHVSIELSDAEERQLFIPAGFAHGFVTLEDGVSVTYKVSSYYAPECEGGVRWNDPDVAVGWPLSGSSMTLSPRDEQQQLLKEVQSPFIYDGSPLSGWTTLELK